MALNLFGNGRGKDESPEFEQKWEEYKETHKSLKQLESNIKAHLEVTKRYVASCAEISIQIASFFTSSDEDVSQRTRAFGTANAEIERIQLSSVQKLYEDEVLQPLNVLWNLDAEIHRCVKKRKELIKIRNKKDKALKEKLSEKSGVEEELRKEKETGKAAKKMFKKRKSISEVNREVVDKRRELEEASDEQNAMTQLIIRKFDSLQQNKKSGQLISSPIAGIVACEHHLAMKTKEKLDSVRSMFTEQQVYSRTLKKYDASQVNGVPIDAVLDTATANGFVFGRMLTNSTPSIVCDCVSYIRQGLKAEGLFRIPGNRSHVEEIRKSYDANEMDILNTREDIDIHDVCSALKLYFNTLPEPLIPYAAYDELERYFDNEAMGRGADTKAVIAIIQRVANPQKGLIGYMLNFLYDIKKNQEFNQMTAANLATCFAPVFFRPRPGSGPDAAQQTRIKNLKNIGANIATTNILIENARSFGVPPNTMIEKALHITEKTLQRVQRTYMHAGSQHQRTVEATFEGMNPTTPSMNFVTPGAEKSKSTFEEPPVEDMETNANWRGGHTFDRGMIEGLVKDTQNSTRGKVMINRENGVQNGMNEMNILDPSSSSPMNNMPPPTPLGNAPPPPPRRQQSRNHEKEDPLADI